MHIVQNLTPAEQLILKMVEQGKALRKQAETGPVHIMNDGESYTFEHTENLLNAALHLEAECYTWAMLVKGLDSTYTGVLRDVGHELADALVSLMEKGLIARVDLTTE